jgi:hypothetical protein
LARVSGILDRDCAVLALAAAGFASCGTMASAAPEEIQVCMDDMTKPD